MPEIVPLIRLPTWSVFLVSVLLVAEADGAKSVNSDSTRTILFFGNSLTSGYGVGREAAFPTHIQSRIDSLEWAFRVINAGLSGETSAAGLRRIDWVLRQPIDVFVLELGGNDGLRGLPLDQTEKNLAAILDRVRAKFEAAALVVAGMQLPPNLGPTYTTKFREIFPHLAESRGALLIPFLLENVGGTTEFMSTDGIHPNTAGHALVADNVWEALEPILREIQNGSTGFSKDLERRSLVNPAATENPNQNSK